MIKKQTPVLLAAVVAAALTLAACGGGSGTSSTTATTTGAASQQGQGEASGQGSGTGKGNAKSESAGKNSQQRSGGQGQSKGKGAQSSGDTGPSPRHVSGGPLRVSGGGSAQFKVAGGDNSIQEFGTEGDESELREVAERVHSFYVARLAGEWAKACSYLAKSTAEGLEQLTENSPQLKGKGCAGGLAAFTKAVSPTLQRQLTTVDAAALRSEGEQSFLIYTGPPGKTVYAMPLRSEAGEWKLGAITGAAMSGT